ncbi:c-type cytochrome [Allorhodopirellula solitaria]|uniref:Cytochrome c n=1 Tax=Allorhodopirellula solitaria TaxID=2527987 RepID=A0A5C5XPD0_9BACT|nr:c-type cytochrome [Allorhodopirellula solitaria]TWT64764.1 Cytochrome c [Allorhodopirellula solitaria]
MTRSLQIAFRSRPITLLFAAITTSTLLGVLLVSGSFHRVSAADGPVAGTSTPPTPPSELPPGELGRVIELGRDIVNNTKDHPLSKAYVGNSLNCTSCHLDGGTHPEAGTFLGIATAYPAWSPREQRVITLQDRVLNCFMRSQNGVRPPQGSNVSIAVTAYITWLSTGEKIKQNPDKPLGPHHVPGLAVVDGSTLKGDVERGATLYEDHCASCHGDEGLGGVDGPPVWGDQSYNNGAGLSRELKLASWLKVAMPLDDPYLSEQEAFDIAAFVNSHDRPEFELQQQLPAAERLGEYNAESTGK